MIALAVNVLLLERINGGEPRLDLEPVDLAHLADDVAALSGGQPSRSKSIPVFTSGLISPDSSRWS